jgi:hypothetical protein
MKLTIEAAISEFGIAAKAKLANPAVTGQPEDQIRAPFEQLLLDMWQSVSRRSVTSRPGRIMQLPFRNPLSDLSNSRLPAKAVTLESSRTLTTKVSRKGCARYPTCSIQTAMDSVSGKMENSLVRFFIWMETLNLLEPNSLHHPACKRSLKTFFVGSRLRRTVRAIWPMARRQGATAESTAVFASAPQR